MDNKTTHKSINIVNSDLYLATHRHTQKRLTLSQFDIYLAIHTHRLASLCRSVLSKWEMSCNTLINGTFIRLCYIQMTLTDETEQ